MFFNIKNFRLVIVCKYQVKDITIFVGWFLYKLGEIFSSKEFFGFTEIFCTDRWELCPYKNNAKNKVNFQFQGDM